MSSVFSKIVSGEIPSYKVAETTDFLAFLDVLPLVKGHTLVIPKKETDYIFDLSDAEFAGLQLFSKKVARALMQVIPCKRIGTAVIGLEVPHAHIHLVPINSMKDLNFQNPKLKFIEAEMEQTASAIQKAYANSLTGQP
jgi:histidine triad (HIT) family protein